MVTTGAIRRAKLQSNHHQQTNIQWADVLPVTQPTNEQRQSTTEKTLSYLLALHMSLCLSCVLYAISCVGGRHNMPHPLQVDL